MCEYSSANEMFSGQPLSDYLRRRHTEMLAKIDALPAESLQDTEDAEWVERFVSTYRVEPLVLSDPVEPGVLTETRLPGRDQFGSDVLRDAYLATLRVPFTGDASLFGYKLPLRTATSSPTSRVTVGSHSLLLRSQDMRTRAKAIERELRFTLDHIGDSCRLAKSEVDKWNGDLPASAAERLHRRRAQVVETAQVIAEFAFPMVRRLDAPTAFVPQVASRHVEIAPVPRPRSRTPEHHLTDGAYRGILSDLEGMGEVIERCPAAFSEMSEESLRWVLLVPLNLLYEGQATGETFSVSGKTDILVRAGARAVFIAECKIWDGKKSLLQAVDQLFSYISWRDTKCAVVLFNRNRKHSAVVGAIPEVIRSHRAYVRDLAPHSEGCTCYTLRRPDDPGAEITVAVLVLHVPQPESPNAPERAGA